MEKDIIQMLVQNTDELPSFPMVAQRIIQVAESRTATAKDLGDILVMDPSLTAKTLRIVNSSLYALRSRVTTVSHAIALLGFNEIKNMVLGVSIFNAFRGMGEASTSESISLWEHSIACGMFSKSVSNSIHMGSSDEAFIGGLVHDIGKILIKNLFPQDFREAVRKASAGEEDFWNLEREMFGAPHTEVGDWLARYWGLPRIHRCCIRYHHSNPKGESIRSDGDLMMAIIVKASDFFLRLFDVGFNANPWVKTPPNVVWELIGLKESDYERIFLALGEEIDDVRDAFGLEATSRGPSIQTGETSERVKGKSCLLYQASPKVMDPVKLVLNSLGMRCESASIEKDLIQKAKSVGPDFFLLDLLGYSFNGERLMPLLRRLREEIARPIVILGQNGWGKMQKDLLSEGPTSHFEMMPSRSNLLKEISRIISLNAEHKAVPQ